MIGIVITVHNRPEYLFHCFESLKRANLPKCIIVIVDDFSSDYKVGNLIAELSIKSVDILKIRTNARIGVKVATRLAMDAIFHKCDYFMTLDGDAMVRKDFVDRIMALPKDSIATGFHCTTKNRDGSERHHIIYETDLFYLKRSVGGINMGFTKEVYLKYVEPALMMPGNWDHEACKNIGADGKGVYCVKESVVQHLGEVSSIRIHVFEKPDVANDFYLHNLSSVTLVGIDSNYERVRKSIDKCKRFFRFGDIKILSHVDGEYVTRIPHIKSRAEYSQFVLKGLAKYIQTEHFLIVQHDSWIINPSAWEEQFLNYDYIGAVWNWYDDSFRVGNGGFSLRSSKLARILKHDGNIIPKNDHIIKEHQEDHNICRIYRKYLEDHYRINFADEAVAERFSVENWAVKPPHNKYKGSFGFHGFGKIDYSEAYISEPRP